MGVNMRGLRAYAGRLGRLRGGCDGFTRESAQALGEDYLESVRAASPVDEGELRDSWALRDTASGVCVENHAAHAFYVEHGHRSRGSGWIEGQHFQQSCEAELEERLPGELGRRLEGFMKEGL